MLRATADITLPTAIIGSLPRPSCVRRELGLPEAECRAADGRYSLWSR